MNKIDKQVIDLNNKAILVTGAAGFIGSFLCQRLLKETCNSIIIGLDCITDYNPVELKHWRLRKIDQMAMKSNSAWKFIKGDIADKELIKVLFQEYKFAVIVNLAAQAGVRYSIEHPDAYIHSNIIGFYNLLEAARHGECIEHFVFASSSSVYGGNKKIPFSVEDKVDNPVSLYAATKKSNELMAHSYSKLYNIPITGLRFFTVYGPAGRTDMFYFSATNNLRAGKSISIFNYGKCKRDFTYIEDIIEGIFRVMRGAPKKENGKDNLPIPPYAVYNIGGGKPENLLEYLDVLQQALVRYHILPEGYDFEIHKKLVPMQPGDVSITYADCTALERDYDFRPSIGIRDGLDRFARWYGEFYL